MPNLKWSGKNFDRVENNDKIWPLVDNFVWVLRVSHVIYCKQKYFVWFKWKEKQMKRKKEQIFWAIRWEIYGKDIYTCNNSHEQQKYQKIFIIKHANKMRAKKKVWTAKIYPCSCSLFPLSLAEEKWPRNEYNKCIQCHKYIK